MKKVDKINEKNIFFENIEDEFRNIQNSGNPELINDFIIKIGKKPHKKYLKYIKDLIENSNTEIKNKILLNIAWIIGEIGKLNVLDNYFIDFLIDEYDNSDQWIRNEILEALFKIYQNKKINCIPAINTLIIASLSDDYKPIILNGLKLCMFFEEIPENVMKIVLRNLNKKDKDISLLIQEILEKKFNFLKLFNFLDKDYNYKILNKIGIRKMISSICTCLFDVEDFIKKIEESNWEREFKDLYIEELKILQKIMIKQL